MALLDDFLKAHADDLSSELVASAELFNARLQVCRRIYKEDFSETQAGNPGEFQACMVLLKMWQDDARSIDLDSATWGKDA
jgi:hypothetical protein